MCGAASERRKGGLMPECHLCGVEDHLSDLEACQWCECLTCEDCGRDCEQEDGDPVGFFCDDCIEEPAENGKGE